jgi:hypothetical protein
MDIQFWAIVLVLWPLCTFTGIMIVVRPLPQYGRWLLLLRIAGTCAEVSMTAALTISTAWSYHPNSPPTPQWVSPATWALWDLFLVFGALMALFYMARTPEAARMLHVPPRLYTWLSNRDINERTQISSLPHPFTGDHT